MDYFFSLKPNQPRGCNIFELIFLLCQLVNTRPGGLMMHVDTLFWLLFVVCFVLCFVLCFSPVCFGLVCFAWFWFAFYLLFDLLFVGSFYLWCFISLCFVWLQDERCWTNWTHLSAFFFGLSRFFANFGLFVFVLLRRYHQRCITTEKQFFVSRCDGGQFLLLRHVRFFGVVSHWDLGLLFDNPKCGHVCRTTAARCSCSPLWSHNRQHYTSGHWLIFIS